MTVRQSNDRDLILSTKLLLPERLWRLMTKPVAAILRTMPEKLIYARGLAARKRKRLSLIHI